MEKTFDPAIYNPACDGKSWAMFYAQHVSDNHGDIATIAEAAARILNQNFGINLIHNEPGVKPEIMNDSRLYTSIFISAIGDLLKTLKNQMKNRSEAYCNMAGRFIVGISNAVNEDDEKSGNLMPVFVHINNLGIETNDEFSTNVEILGDWIATNTMSSEKGADPKALSRFYTAAASGLEKQLDVKLQSTQIILPVVICYYEALCQYLKTRRFEIASVDSSAWEFTIPLYWFNASCRPSKKVGDKIVLEPTVAAKTYVKNDEAVSTD